MATLQGNFCVAVGRRGCPGDDPASRCTSGGPSSPCPVSWSCPRPESTPQIRSPETLHQLCPLCPARTPATQDGDPHSYRIHRSMHTRQLHRMPATQDGAPHTSYTGRGPHMHESYTGWDPALILATQNGAPHQLHRTGPRIHGGYTGQGPPHPHRLQVHARTATYTGWGAPHQLRKTALRPL